MNEKCKSHILFLAARTVPNVTSITINRDILETYPNRSNLMIEDDHPDIELILAASSFLGDVSGTFRSLLGVTDEFYKEVYGDYEGLDAFTIVPVLLRPKSRGRLTLRSTDQSDPPIIDMNYYDHEDDLNTMVQAIKMVRESLYINIYNIFFVLNLFLITLFVTIYFQLHYYTDKYEKYFYYNIVNSY